MRYELRKASPAGCAISLVGIALLSVSGICLWGTYVGFCLPEDHPSSALWTRFLIGAIVSFLGATIILRISWKMAIGSEKPKIRW